MYDVNLEKSCTKNQEVYHRRKCKNYIHAERLIYKRTMANRMLFFVPFVTIVFAFLAAGIYYYQYSSMYWWYMFLLSGIIGVMCFYSAKIDETSGYQQTIYSLPVDLKKISLIKSIVLLGKMFLMKSVLTFFVWLLPFLLFPDYQTISLGRLILGNIMIIVTCAWQIPFCFLLMKKLGKFIPILINLVIAIATTVVIGKTAFWIAWPYCWTGKEMEYFLGINLSGTPMESAVTFGTGHFAAIVLSILLFGLFLYLDAKVFEKGRD